MKYAFYGLAIVILIAILMGCTTSGVIIIAQDAVDSCLAEGVERVEYRETRGSKSVEVEC